MNHHQPPSGSFDHGSSSHWNEQNDCSDTTLKFISDMLMEELDLENMPCMLHDCLAVLAAQRTFQAALHNDRLDENTTEDELLRISMERAEREREYHNQMAQNALESFEMYDDVLLSSNINAPPPPTQPQNIIAVDPSKKVGRGRKRGAGLKAEIIDLRGLLVKCAQSMSKLDFVDASNTLSEIRLHSNPQGKSLQRAAHYLANALEARLTGTGSTLFTALNTKRRSAAQVLNAYKMFITACPFRKMSGVLANKAIEKLATGETSIHIIDFGILYGFQWPSLIQLLSERPGGPPRLRITGIEFPQNGNRPGAAVEETGRRLAKYCDRFGVPFEYNGIAKNWETIRIEELKIENDEVVVVNSLYRLHNLMDEIVNNSNPRDDVLKLIRSIDPAMFIHGVSNGNYNAPFFITRFKEAMFHFTNMFDMLEATVPPEDEDRLLFEEHILGKMAMNVIACEGMERVERPELYKHWQMRMKRIGFRQVRLDQDIVGYVRSTIETAYHKNFYVDEDEKWLLLGWKGRVNEAMSIWKHSGN